MLNIRNLKISFGAASAPIQVVRGVNIDVGNAEILGIVGESGSGKSLTCLSIMQLLGPNSMIDGRIEFKGNDLLELDEAEITKIRGGEISMIFQDALGSLNPVQTIGKQLAEALRLNTTPVTGATSSGLFLKYTPTTELT